MNAAPDPRQATEAFTAEATRLPAAALAMRTVRVGDDRRGVSDPLDLLTSRGREVLQLLAEGKTNQEIASMLNLSIYTVDAHRGRIMEKLNLHSIGELVRFALRHGLIH